MQWQEVQQASVVRLCLPQQTQLHLLQTPPLQQPQPQPRPPLALQLLSSTLRVSPVPWNSWTCSMAAVGEEAAAQLTQRGQSQSPVCLCQPLLRLPQQEQLQPLLSCPPFSSLPPQWAPPLLLSVVERLLATGPFPADGWRPCQCQQAAQARHLRLVLQALLLPLTQEQPLDQLSALQQLRH